MLKTLTISNYALIDNITVDFNPGLTIITGETGAGKSILIGALNLLTGARADTSVLKDKQKKCVVEGVFDLSKYNLQEFFEQNDLDYETFTIIRREITPQGRSRAFINDTPVNLKTLRDLTNFLIDIHSQHDTLLLNNPGYQLDVIDTYADNSKLLQQYRTEFSRLKNLQQQLSQLREKAQKEKADYDYYQFQYDQLEQANLQPGEQEDLEQEQQQLSHTEEIKNALGQILFLLTDEENGANDRIRQAQRSAEEITSYLPQAKDLARRLESAYIELQDLASETEVLFNDIEYDPERLQQVNARLDLIYELQHKFNVESVEQLLELKDQFEQKLLNINSYDEQIQQLETQVQQQLQKVERLANQLSERRQAAITVFEKEVMQLLRQLGMPNAVFNVKIEKTDLSPTGHDKITFYFSANKKIEPQPITKVASGGELSRLMLAIKYLVSQSKTLPTIIFDEIDTGISGEIADKTGQLIKKLSKNIQVIDITHLPQIAAKADTHILVYKTEQPSGTVTRLKVLSDDERVKEIAKMLSGQQVTQSAIEHARSLIENSEA